MGKRGAWEKIWSFIATRCALGQAIPRNTGFVAMEGVRPTVDSGKKKESERMTLTSGPGVSVREENGTRSSAVEEGRGGRACCWARPTVRDERRRRLGPRERWAGARVLGRGGKKGRGGFGPSA